jgi:hypothetical protein
MDTDADQDLLYIAEEGVSNKIQILIYFVF